MTGGCTAEGARDGSCKGWYGVWVVWVGMGVSIRGIGPVLGYLALFSCIGPYLAVLSCIWLYLAVLGCI